jgi:peroxiredoxin Q/BCP
MTPGCTVEACSFRDRLSDLKKHSVKVLGISADSVARHKKFAEKYNLNFPLLSDPEKKTIQSYGVLVEKSMFGKKYMGIQRDSFLIGKDGAILKHYKKVKPEKHVEEVLEDLQSLL